MVSVNQLDDRYPPDPVNGHEVGDGRVGLAAIRMITKTRGRTGFAPHDAQDLTQAFFERLLERNWIGDADRERGRFRTFLLTAMSRFLANEWDKARAQKRGGQAVHVPVQLDTAETRYGHEPADNSTPEQCYERRWALTLLDTVLRRLRAGGLKTAILSNGEPKMLEAGAHSAGLDGLLDAILSVEEVGAFKPEPRVYQLAVERLGVPADAIAFQSSNAWDVHGAACFGLRPVWINRQNAPRERLPGAPEHELGDLSGLPALLGL